MESPRQDPEQNSSDAVAEIAAAIASLRRPPGPPRGATPRHGGLRGRELGGAAMHRLLHVLAQAAERDEQLGVSEVAEAIGVDQPRSSRLVTAGVERGYVIRQTDARDARRSVIRITDEGRAHLEHVRDRRRASVEAALADFSPEDTATLAALLARFVHTFGRNMSV